MTGLLKSDFKRFFQDKLFLVVCILGVVFAAITPLLYAVLVAMMGEMDPMTESMLGSFMTAKGQFFSCFSFGNNLGLIAPLLIGIVLFKDFSYGTIRNKIISGHSRSSIFLSIFVVCLIALFGTILVHALLTLGISLPFFDYQATPFEMADLWYLLESLLFELLVYVCVAAFVSWLCVMMRNIGTLIVMYVAVVLGFTMIGTIIQTVGMVMAMEPGMETTADILDFFNRINVFMSSATIGQGMAYEAKDVWYYVLPPAVGTAALLGHGLWRFGRKDLK